MYSALQFDVVAINRSVTMQTAEITRLYSKEFQELQLSFHSMRPPYGLCDILAFNRTYQRIYGKLSREERRRAEEFVDALIRGVANEEWASKIFGVV
jgi:hypothetical protein